MSIADMLCSYVLWNVYKWSGQYSRLIILIGVMYNENERIIRRGEFVVSAEVGPPKGIHVDELVEEAKLISKMFMQLT